ncbi:hypothetical protein [Vibrio kanaloae]|uniref:hypothetical protein n=1 Tax=Vibrio kanaloae TaxID=170673 RepID=UPI001247973E|nr:hypothetical protein [Vibrio kanaloae]KAB0463167.1 hypothetical protein F7Q89_14810 [Vibrio kanaloae]
MAQFNSETAKVAQSKSVESRHRNTTLRNALKNDSIKVVSELIKQGVDVSGLKIDNDILASAWKDVVIKQMQFNHERDMLILKSELAEIDRDSETESESDTTRIDNPKKVWSFEELATHKMMTNHSCQEIVDLFHQNKNEINAPETNQLISIWQSMSNEWAKYE